MSSHDVIFVSANPVARILFIQNIQMEFISFPELKIQLLF